jgi:hypothetical protein
MTRNKIKAESKGTVININNIYTPPDNRDSELMKHEKVDSGRMKGETWFGRLLSFLSRFF